MPAFSGAPDGGAPVIDVRQVMVTPAMADAWLRNNACNRNMRADEVERYARDMREGHWHLTGDTIKVAPDGRLLDGQHRAAAILEANITIPMFVARNVDPDTQVVMDTGIARLFADQLKMMGVGYPTLSAAIVRHVMAWDLGDPWARSKISHSDMLEALPFFADLADISEFAHKNRYKLTTGSRVGTMRYVLDRIDPTQSQQFFVDLHTGANMEFTDPVMAYRRRVESDRDVPTTREALILLMVAWNHRRDNRYVNKLVIPRGWDISKVPIPK